MPRPDEAGTLRAVRRHHVPHVALRAPAALVVISVLAGLVLSVATPFGPTPWGPAPAGAAGPTDYQPVSPSRILDTRHAIGTPGTRPLGREQTMIIDVTDHPSVPDTASAVVLNVTVTEPTAPSSYLTVWPAGEERPLASNLNFVESATVANLVVVKVGASGGVAFYNHDGDTHVIADLAGYHPEGAAYQPASPRRLLDTRDGTGAAQSSATGPLGQGETRVLDLVGPAGVPLIGAGAVTVNVTVTGPTASGGYLTLWPAGQPRPTASNLNFDPGQTRANLAIVEVGGTDTRPQISLYNFAGATHVVVDIAGVVPVGDAADADGDGEADYDPRNPLRILDTRNGTGTDHGALTQDCAIALPLDGISGLDPSRVAAVALNVTATQPTADTGSYLTVYPAGQERPTASNVNFRAGQTVPNMVIVRVGAGGVALYNFAGSTHVVADLVGTFPGTPMAGTVETDCPPPPPPPPPPEPVRGVLCIGDSVMKGAGPQYSNTLVMCDIVDAEVSRQFSSADDVARSYGPDYPDHVVVHLGTNGTVTASQIDDLLHVLRDVPVVVLMNNQLNGQRSWEGPNNRTLAEGVARWGNARLADWKGLSDPHPEYFRSDGFHLTPTGAQAYADLIQRTLDA